MAKVQTTSGLLAAILNFGASNYMVCCPNKPCHIAVAKNELGEARKEINIIVVCHGTATHFRFYGRHFDF
jgi:hypothetical protein